MTAPAVANVLLMVPPDNDSVDPAPMVSDPAPPMMPEDIAMLVALLAPPKLRVAPLMLTVPAPPNDAPAFRLWVADWKLKLPAPPAVNAPVLVPPPPLKLSVPEEIWKAFAALLLLLRVAENSDDDAPPDLLNCPLPVRLKLAPPVVFWIARSAFKSNRPAACVQEAPLDMLSAVVAVCMLTAALDVTAVPALMACEPPPSREATPLSASDPPPEMVAAPVQSKLPETLALRPLPIDSVPTFCSATLPNEALVLKVALVTPPSIRRLPVATKPVPALLLVKVRRPLTEAALAPVLMMPVPALISPPRASVPVVESSVVLPPVASVPPSARPVPPVTARVPATVDAPSNVASATVSAVLRVLVKTACESVLFNALVSATSLTPLPVTVRFLPPKLSGPA